jgi:hypothetical protein
MTLFRAPSSPSLLLVLLTAGCAPALVNGTMQNPARTNEKLSSMQEYDVGPYRENHRYMMTLQNWTPSSLGVEIKVADVDDCGKTDSYSYTLVDDQGAQHALKPTGDAKLTTEKGRGTAILNVATLDGSFDVPIGPDSHAVTIQQRPKPGASCPALDFHWTFQ